MELLLLLLAVHFIGDFYLQPASWLVGRHTKAIKSKGFWKHFLVRTLLNTLVLLISDLSLLPAIISIVILSIAQFFMDYWKSYRINNLRYFLIDQIIHILIISMVWAYLANFTLEQALLFIANFITAKNMLIAISYILVCKPASVIISLALKTHTQSLVNDTAIDHEENNNVGLLSAGAWIGYIERCLAISFIFMGQFSSIGFLVATKTIFRFGDLTKNKDMKLTEYMMLGTLLSYAIALFVGWNALQIYQAL